ncbi:TrbI F-type domain-containing protein, partial [Sphingobium sp.]|uniref:TrbI F-type domain-containing protein n=1 Tax=Sphingobium sp. TaxID=1912891 RepID=UPI002C7E3EE9
MIDRETPASPTFPDVSVPAGRPPGRQGGRTLGLRDILAVGALVGLVCWGAWVTQSLVDGNRERDRFVKLQLQGLIAEYLQAQARSGN